MFAKLWLKNVPMKFNGLRNEVNMFVTSHHLVSWCLSFIYSKIIQQHKKTYIDRCLQSLFTNFCIELYIVLFVFLSISLNFNEFIYFARSFCNGLKHVKEFIWFECVRHFLAEVCTSVWRIMGSGVGGKKCASNYCQVATA